ncbi:hypothetical protein LBMAG42_54550 [Deltaproteobacteria bacterium]|nr:hypothetical protein LBMAG42_54550 [Deltaproteobacteria bacterium]
MTVLLPLLLGCAHITSVSAPASGDFYVVVERYVPVPLLFLTAGISVPQGYVLHCRERIVDGARETRCVRALDHTQVLEFAPGASDPDDDRDEPCDDGYYRSSGDCTPAAAASGVPNAAICEAYRAKIAELAATGRIGADLPALPEECAR